MYTVSKPGAKLEIPVQYYGTNSAQEGMMLRYTALAALSAAFFMPLAVLGGDVNRSWDVLAGAVKAGQKVTVTRMNLANVDGKLLSIDGQSITVRQATGPQTIQRADVFRVRRPSARGCHALYGALIGAGAGAAILVATDKQPKQTSEAVAMGVILGGLAGFVAGYAIPVGPPLYEAEKPAGKPR